MDSKKFERRTDSRMKNPSEALDGLDFPVVGKKAEIMQLAREHDHFVLVGETGSGKTTCLPLMLLELREELGLKGRIAVTQPRVVAATSVSRRVSEMAGSQLGQEIGYIVKGDNKTSKDTDLIFMTEGILIRQVQFDPLLKDYSIVMVDEAHERSLNIDFTLGLLKSANIKRAAAGIPPIRIIVTSATIEKGKFSQYLDPGISDSRNSIEVSGKMYPVEVFYEKSDPIDYTKAAAERVRQIFESSEPGDILIFMPGAEEIKHTINQIQLIPNISKEFDILTLHSSVTPEDQSKVFRSSSKRKIIVSTNIAETSVTVPGVRHVIDSGYIKQVKFDESTGIQQLALTKHAISGLNQRAGRAGRVAPGKCYRLFTSEDFAKRVQYQIPEILRTELAGTVLTLKKMGVSDLRTFDFIDPPRSTAIEQAVETLKNLGALDRNGNITEIGISMSEFPLEPTLSRMIVESLKYDCVEDICTIVSCSNSNNIFIRPTYNPSDLAKAEQIHSTFRNPSSDFLTYLSVWEAYMKISSTAVNRKEVENWARANFLNLKTLEGIRKTRSDLLKILKDRGITVQKSPTRDVLAIGKSITAGLAGNILRKSGKFSYNRLSNSGEEVMIHPSSGLFSSARDTSMLVAKQIVRASNRDRGDKIYARECHAVDEKWLAEVAPQFLEESTVSSVYDPATDTVVRTSTLRLKGDYSGKTYGIRNEIATDDVASRRLVEYIFGTGFKSNASLQNKFPQVYQLVTNANLSLQSFELFWVRSGGFINGVSNFPRKNLEDLKSYFYNALVANKISSMAMLDKALSDGLDISFNPFSSISIEEQTRILEGNPEKILINGKEYDVDYGVYSYNSTLPSITISLEDSIHLKESDFTLPSGRNLSVRVLASGGLLTTESNYGSFVAKCSYQFALRLFDNFKKAKDFTIDLVGLAPDYDIEKIQRLPNPVVFGTNPFTNEPLMAYYGYYFDRGSYPYPASNYKYFISLFLTADQAETSNKSFFEEVEKIKKEELNRKEARRREELEKERLRLERETYGAQALKDYQETEKFFTNNPGYRFHYECIDLYNEFSRLRYQLDSSPLKVIEEIKRIVSRVESFLEQNRDVIRVNIENQEIFEKFSTTCPLCGASYSNNICRNFSEHFIAVQSATAELTEDNNRILISRLKFVEQSGVEHICGTVYYDSFDSLENSLNKSRVMVTIQSRYRNYWNNNPGKIVLETMVSPVSSEVLKEGLNQAEQEAISRGILKLGRDPFEEKDIYTTKDPNTGNWVLVQFIADGRTLPMKGFRGGSVGPTIEQLIKNYCSGFPLELERTLANYRAALDSLSESERTIFESKKSPYNISSPSFSRDIVASDSPFAQAFKKASEPSTSVYSSPSQPSEAELARLEREKNEKDLAKLKSRLAERYRYLGVLHNKEVEKAITIKPDTYGLLETESSIGEKGVKLVTEFTNGQAKIVDWNLGKVILLQGEGLDGTQFVEITEELNSYFDETDGLPCTVFRVQKIDNTKTDKDLLKLQRRIQALEEILASDK